MVRFKPDDLNDGDPYFVIDSSGPWVRYQDAAAALAEAQREAAIWQEQAQIEHDNSARLQAFINATAIETDWLRARIAELEARS